MIKIRRTKEVFEELFLTKEQAKEVTIQYLDNVILGEHYFVRDGELFYNEFCRATVTEEFKGKASKEQLLAQQLLKILKDK